MKFLVKLVVEGYDIKDKDIKYLFGDGSIPCKEITKCPKQICVDILNEELGLDMDIEDRTWVMLEIIDVIEDKTNDTSVIYLVIGARIPETIPTKTLQWISCQNLINSDIPEIDAKIIQKFTLGI